VPSLIHSTPTATASGNHNLGRIKHARATWRTIAADTVRYILSRADLEAEMAIAPMAISRNRINVPMIVTRFLSSRSNGLLFARFMALQGRVFDLSANPCDM
jgi:hypothetical protein